MADLPVLVITAVSDADDADLLIVIVATVDGVDKISGVITLKDGAAFRDGNPFGVYGDAVEAFTGCNKYQTSITVANCRSGGLSNWQRRHNPHRSFDWLSLTIGWGGVYFSIAKRQPRQLRQEASLHPKA